MKGNTKTRKVAFLVGALGVLFILYLVLYGTVIGYGPTISPFTREDDNERQNSTVNVPPRSSWHVGLGQTLRKLFGGIKRTDDFSKEDHTMMELATATKPTLFDSDGSDILVNLHIQKTGGSIFEAHLVLDTNVKPPCACTQKKKNTYMCKCQNRQGQQWMFQRSSVAWPCGIHADFTQLTECVPGWFDKTENSRRKRIFHYVTVVREPIARFLSEWMVVKHGAEWGPMNLTCDGQRATRQEVPPCPKLGPGVSFEDFVSCKSNLALNRQARMLANLSLSDCYRLKTRLSRQKRDIYILDSAKRNLAFFFRYFGLSEYQQESARLFNHLFSGLALNVSKFVNKPAATTNAENAFSILTPHQLQRVRGLNALDVELYRFAKSLFFSRLNQFGIPLIKD